MNQSRQNHFFQNNSLQNRPYSLVCPITVKNQKIKILNRSVQVNTIEGPPKAQFFQQQQSKQNPKIKIISRNNNTNYNNSNVLNQQQIKIQFEAGSLIQNQYQFNNKRLGSAINPIEQNFQQKICQKQTQNDVNRQKQEQNSFVLKSTPKQNPQQVQMTQGNQKIPCQKVQQLQSDSSMVSVLQSQKMLSCYYCSQYTNQTVLVLSCFHSYHIECLKDYLDKQIDIQKQELCTCTCKSKIAQKLIQNNFPNLFQKLLNNQLSKIKKQFSSNWLICKECQVFFCQSSDKLQTFTNLFCLNCNKNRMFERIK